MATKIKPRRSAEADRPKRKTMGHTKRRPSSERERPSGTRRKSETTRRPASSGKTRNSKSNITGARAAKEKSEQKSKLFHRGNEGRKRVETELKRSEARRNSSNIYRFRLKDGETKQITILDDPQFFLYEHTMQDPKTKKWGMVLTCIQDIDNCPICEQVGNSTYVMYLSVINHTGFERSNGEWVPFTRELMVVKPQQQKKFLKKMEQYGTLRGCIVDVSRTGGAKSPAIGDDFDFSGTRSEDELMEDFWNVWEDREGKTHEDNLGEPIKYEEVIEVHSREYLEALVGAEPTPGSDREASRQQANDDWEDEEEEDWEDEEETEEEPEEEEWEEDEPEEEEFEEEEEAEDPPWDEDEEEEEEEEEPPKRRKPTASARPRNSSSRERSAKRPARSTGRSQKPTKRSRSR